MKMARSSEFDLESARCCALFLMLNDRLVVLKSTNQLQKATKRLTNNQEKKHNKQMGTDLSIT